MCNLYFKNKSVDKFHFYLSYIYLKKEVEFFYK